MRFGDAELMVEETNLTREELQKNIEENLPDVWRLCYPRCYEDKRLGDYYSPKFLAFDLAASVLKRAMPGSARAELYDYLVANQLVRFGVPTYFVSRELIEAIAKTTPPLSIAWHDMQLPFDAAAFMLPKGTLRHSEEGDCPYIAYARLKKDETYLSPLSPIPGKRHGITNGGFVLLTSTIQPPHTYHYHWPYVYEGGVSMPVIRLNELDACMDRSAEVDDTSRCYFPEGLLTPDHDVIRAAAHYVFGCILLMLHRPDLIEPGTLLKRIAKPNKPPREFWTPHFLGRKYRVRRENASESERGPTGEVLRRRGGWVMGYWREQHYGPQWSLSKHVWIEPLFRQGVG
jgi:hypothetical protein